MAATVTTPPEQRRRSRKGKVALIIIGALLALLLILYFFLTSAYFIKSYVLPKASKTLNAQITVEDISVSPFSSASLRGLKVTTTGEPLLTADAAEVRYSLMDIMGGKMNVSELKVQSPKVLIVQNADGSSNLDPILKALESQEKPKDPEPDEAGEKPELNIRNLSLANGEVTITQTAKNGDQQVTRLSDLNLSIDQIVTGSSGKLQMDATLLVDQQVAEPAQKNLLESKATADFEFLITPDLMPESLKGKGELKVAKADGTFADLAGMVAALNADVSPTEVKDLRMTFNQNGETLGAVTVAGPMDMNKGEARLNVIVEPLGKKVLNLAGAAMGYDFGSTQISSTNVVELNQKLSTVKVDGQFSGQQFTLAKGDQQVAPMDFVAHYSIQQTAGTTNATIQINTLNVNARQKGREILTLKVTQPLTISPGAPISGTVPLEARLQQLDLADWKPLVGQAASGGLIDASVNLSFADAGKEIQATFQADAKNVTLVSTNNTAAAPFNSALRGRFTVQNLQTVQGNATANITGKMAGVDLNNLQAAVDLAMTMNTQKVSISRMNVSLQHAGKPAGTLDASGSFNRSTSAGTLEYRLADLNENLLAPFAAPYLTNATLTSVTINSIGNVTVDPKAASALKTELQVTRLLVTDKEGKLPKEPLTASAKVDASITNKVLNLRTAQLNLSPTDRAKNELTVTGHINASQTNAITGNLKVASDGLDLTHYYDIFTGTTSPTDANTQPPPPAPSDPNKEPDAVVMPFRNFTAELDVKKLYLRQVAAENCRATVLLDGSNFKLDPAQLTLNGAPLSARITADLSVPGYRYDLTAKADKLPLAPLANSFAPNYKDRAAGDLFAEISLKGAGTTDKNLQKHLAANMSLNFTNANIQIVERGKFYPVLAAVALALQVPEVLNSPLNAIGADMKIASGQIDISRAIVYSPAFLAGVNGTIPMNEVLTNSPLNLPVNFQLSTNVARRFMTIAANNNSSYAPMPGLFSVKGTIGSPKADINERMIASLLLQSTDKLPIDLGEKGTGILKGIGNILGGNQPGMTNAPGQTSTNQPPSTNKPPVQELFDLFKRKK